ncbi:thiosulfate oxidation carrier protein SoxY [Magnetospirillum fulvum]|uniref:thiosulfate oxidation carrier protein SoxY n=1 Tax=Magnetospirillum fulvum TaxID=1082 RepID=UPI00147C5A65|nr:thiosulfate oxidation carrier protein SoxY [Magnetospirillum fulvum]
MLPGHSRAAAVGRRSVLVGLTLFPLAAKAAAVAVDGPLAEALRGAGIVPEAVVWSPLVTLTAPAIADDGAAVPVTVGLGAESEVTRLHLFAPANRRQVLTSVEPLSDLVRPVWRLRVRLSKSQTIAAVAQLRDGRVVGAMAEVRVTVGGGCRS